MYEWQLIELVLIIQLIGFLLDFNNSVILQYGSFVSNSGPAGVYATITLPISYSSVNYVVMSSTPDRIGDGCYGSEPYTNNSFRFSFVRNGTYSGTNYYLSFGS